MWTSAPSSRRVLRLRGLEDHGGSWQIVKKYHIHINTTRQLLMRRRQWHIDNVHWAGLEVDVCECSLRGVEVVHVQQANQWVDSVSYGLRLVNADHYIFPWKYKRWGWETMKLSFVWIEFYCFSNDQMFDNLTWKMRTSPLTWLS